MMGDMQRAYDYYYHVTEIEPHNAYGHTNLGLLMLGIGSGNYGSLQACGSDEAETAVKHLLLAQKLDPNIRVSLAHTL